MLCVGFATKQQQNDKTQPKTPPTRMPSNALDAHKTMPRHNAKHPLPQHLLATKNCDGGPQAPDGCDGGLDASEGGGGGT